MRRRYYFTNQEISTTPTVINVENVIENNRLPQKNIWQGQYMQVIAISIRPNSEMGVEVHEENDQYIRIEDGEARILLGTEPNVFNYERIVDDNFAIFIPAGTYHNIINVGNEPLKMLSIYSPPYQMTN